MSILNNEAIKILDTEEDVLSSSGKMKSIWDLFTSNIDYKSNQDTQLKVILYSLDESIFSHLDLRDSDCYTACINLCKLDLDDSNDVLTGFLNSAIRSVSEYVDTNTINIKKIDNTQSNIPANADPTYSTEISLISKMEKNKLLNSYSFESLLDNQYLDMVTTAKTCVGNCRKGEPPLIDKGCGVQKAKPLSLIDFGTDVNKIIESGYKLAMSGEDVFPTSANDMKSLVFNENNFNKSNIFSRDNYIQNSANLLVLTATSNIIDDSFQMDNQTLEYAIVGKLNEIEKLLDQFGHTSSLLVAKIMSLVLFLRNIKLNGAIDEHLTEKTLNYFCNELLSSLQELGEYKTDTFKNLSGYITSVKNLPNELIDFVREAVTDSNHGINDLLEVNNKTSQDPITNQTVKTDIDKIVENTMLVKSKLDASRDLLTSSSIIKSDSTDALSSLCEGVEQVSVLESLQEKSSRIFESIHTELNESLVKGDHDNCANCLAKEQVLKEILLENIRSYGFHGDSELSCLNSIERDCSTYGKRISTLSSYGIDTYVSSARDYIKSVW